MYNEIPTAFGHDRPFDVFLSFCFFFFNFWHGQVRRKSVDFAGKSASKLVKLPSFKGAFSSGVDWFSLTGAYQKLKKP